MLTYFIMNLNNHANINMTVVAFFSLLAFYKVAFYKCSVSWGSVLWVKRVMSEAFYECSVLWE